jgi:hypothetical protein
LFRCNIFENFFETEIQTKNEVIFSLFSTLVKSEENCTLHLLEIIESYVTRVTQQDNISEQMLNSLTQLAVCIIGVCKHYFGESKKRHLSYSEFESLFVCLEILATATSTEFQGIKIHLEQHQLIQHLKGLQF